MADKVKDLKICIVGAGMGGLACALALAQKGFKHISVYERAGDLGFVGAGIQLAPNLARVLDRMGCWAPIVNTATNIKAGRIHDGATGKMHAEVKMPDLAERYGYMHGTGHRAHLAGAIYDACRKEGAISFVFNSELVSVDSLGLDGGPVTFTIRKPSTTTTTNGGGGNETPPDPESTPRRVTADILLAADGIKSVTRGAVLASVGSDAQVEDTGQASYRIMLPREKMASDPELLELLDGDRVTRWIGERRHIIAYPIASKTIYNISTCQPDTNFAIAPSATYTTKGSKPAMLKVYETFCPLVQRMLDLVPEGEVCEWKLRVHKPLETWTEGKVALMGDACHPTLPHLNQGAAMAIEDGAVIAEVLDKAASSVAAAEGAAATSETISKQVSKALKVYENLRKERTSTLVDLAAFSGRTLHLGEGKAKEERDRQFAEASEKGKPVPDKWASPDVQHMIYSYDCIKEAREKFDGLLAKL